MEGGCGEQRARTWIIKLSCELITPSKKPGRFPRGQEEIKKDDSDFNFLESISLPREQMVLSQVQAVSPLRFNHVRSSQRRRNHRAALYQTGKTALWVNLSTVETIGFSVPTRFEWDVFIVASTGGLITTAALCIRPMSCCLPHTMITYIKTR